MGYKKRKFQFVTPDKYDECYNTGVSYLDWFIDCKAKLLQNNDTGYIRKYYEEGSSWCCNDVYFLYFESLNDTIKDIIYTICKFNREKDKYEDIPYIASREALKRKININDVELLEDNKDQVTLFSNLKRLFNQRCKRCNTFLLSKEDGELISFVKSRYEDKYNNEIASHTKYGTVSDDLLSCIKDNIKDYKYIITDYKDFCNEYCETHNGKTMDFGKYEGELLINVPLDYLKWIYNEIKGQKKWGVQAHKLREELKKRNEWNK